MNQVLKYSIAPLFVSLFIRYFVARNTGVNILDVRTLAEWELWVYGASLALAGAWAWHVLLRKRCPECDSTSVLYGRVEEYNQVHRIKKVLEKDNNGRTVTRHLNVTMAQLRHYYGCADCSHRWTTESEREK